jgi:hypothetical protein
MATAPSQDDREAAFEAVLGARLDEVHEIENPDVFVITWEELKKQHGL